MHDDMILGKEDMVLVTGANGFIGTRVIGTLIDYGFMNIRCLVRPSGNTERLDAIISGKGYGAHVEVVKGNLLSRGDCEYICSNVSVIIHLAAGIDKSYPGSYMNSVVATRNLLDAAVNNNKTLRRFVNISSFAVYSNTSMRRGSQVDETCMIDEDPLSRHEPYVYGKIKQDDLLMEYHEKYGLPYVIVRPSVVFGPGKKFIPARVGINTFGIFMHIGGRIQLPLTYVDNCAEAIILAGIRTGVDGEVFNIVDDDLPNSRRFLSLYKKHVKKFASIYIPYRIFYLLNALWEKYSVWSEGQLPPVFNRRRCSVYWKGNTYSNRKLKDRLGWKPRVAMRDALNHYFEYQRTVGGV